MHPTYLILTVEDTTRSAAFYESILGEAPLDLGATFGLFRLPDGHKLGLWSRRSILPPVDVAGGSAELGFPVENRAAVDACHARWQEAGIAILQPPTAMDFGYAFTAADPDGHRLRVFLVEDV